MVMFSYFSAASAVFAKSDSFKIFPWAGSTTRGTVLGTGRNKTNTEAIVIPTSGRQNTVRLFLQ